MYWRTLQLVRFSLLTIAAMLSLGYTTRYSGLDATMGLAFAQTGVLYPLFGTMLGWLGVALTGSDTSSNVLFGSLQRITAEQLGLSPTLMAAANSSGGVMGKMIDAQSIVVASTATRWYGHEGDDSAVRVLPQRRARGARRPARLAAGVRAAVYVDGGPVVQVRLKADTTYLCNVAATATVYGFSRTPYHRLRRGVYAAIPTRRSRPRSSGRGATPPARPTRSAPSGAAPARASRS